MRAGEAGQLSRVGPRRSRAAHLHMIGRSFDSQSTGSYALQLALRWPRQSRWVTCQALIIESEPV